MNPLRRLAVCAFTVIAFCTSPAGAESAPVIESFTLDNGLEVIVIPNHRVPAVSHMVWYRVGSADDPPGKSGLAHFHEHIMFKGTAKYKPGEYADIISRHGGQQNAFTGHDATAYYVNISKDELPRVMEMEADRMRGVKPLDEDVDRERQVIIEERRMRVENNPDALLNEQISASLFRHHPYRMPAIGWMHEMETLTKADMLAFHKKWYHPNNAMLIVSGDITAAELRPLAQKYYGGIAKAPLPARQWNKEPPQSSERRVVLQHANVKQPLWYRSYMAPSMAYGNKEQAMPLFVFSQLLGGGKTSRLYQSLVVERKLASAVSVDYSGFSLGPAQFEISITPENGVTLEALEKIVDEEIEKILSETIAPADLSRAKALLRAESIYARDGLSSMARIMGWLRIAGLDKSYFTRWPELIEAVTAEQLAQASRDVFNPRQSVTGWLLPEPAKGGK